MKMSHRAAALALALAGAATGASAASFASTSDTSAWTVSTLVNPHGDGQFASFNPSDPEAVAAVDGRPGWISNTASGTNGSIGDWTFFVFEQAFSLTAEEAATFDLKFTWAADDSGQGFASRGSWVPKYAVNGGPLRSSDWGSSGYTYDMSAVNDVSGFHAGYNTILFYVEGNGVTDGMALDVVSFAPSVPEPGSIGMLAAGLGLLGVMARRAKRQG